MAKITVEELFYGDKYAVISEVFKTMLLSSPNKAGVDEQTALGGALRGGLVRQNGALLSHNLSNLPRKGGNRGLDNHQSCHRLPTASEESKGDAGADTRRDQAVSDTSKRGRIL